MVLCGVFRGCWARGPLRTLEVSSGPALSAEVADRGFACLGSGLLGSEAWLPAAPGWTIPVVLGPAPYRMSPLEAGGRLRRNQPEAR